MKQTAVNPFCKNLGNDSLFREPLLILAENGILFKSKSS